MPPDSGGVARATALLFTPEDASVVDTAVERFGNLDVAI